MDKERGYGLMGWLLVIVIVTLVGMAISIALESEPVIFDKLDGFGEGSLLNAQEREEDTRKNLGTTRITGS